MDSFRNSCFHLGHVLIEISTSWAVCQFQEDYRDPESSMFLIVHKLINNL